MTQVATGKRNWRVSFSFLTYAPGFAKIQTLDKSKLHLSGKEGRHDKEAILVVPVDFP
jgi:hypothetical protein